MLKMEVLQGEMAHFYAKKDRMALLVPTKAF